MPILYEPKGKAREYAALAVNLYNGCAHGCTYCYAPDLVYRNRDSFRELVTVRKNVLQNLSAELEIQTRKPELFENIMNPHVPVLMSFTCDVYQPMPEGMSITREAINLLHDYGYPVQILTKGGLRAANDFDLLTTIEGDAFASTLSFTKDADSIKWEPNAALPDDRLAALQMAHDQGIYTWVSMEPVIDMTQAMEMIKLSAPYVDHFKVGPWDHDDRSLAMDWHNFGWDAKELLEELGKSYYLKRKLRQKMGDIR